MYEDLISGGLGSPGLVDAAAGETLIRSVTPGFNNLVVFLRSCLLWAISCMQTLSSFIRSEPLILGVVAMFFVGFLVSVFFRIYKSC